MAKLITLVVILWSVLVPIAMCTRPAPKRVLRSIQILTFGVVVIWAYLCLAYYPQLVPVD